MEPSKQENEKALRHLGARQCPSAPNETEGVAARFSAAAPTYHPLASIQRVTAEKLMNLLASATEPPPLRAPERILEIGCGTGVLTAILADTFSSALIDAVDVSSAMAAKARGYLVRNKMINWIIADAVRLPEDRKYPLIISNCALHWIAPIETIILKLGDMLAPKGRLAFAVMLDGTLGELNACRQKIAPLKPPRVTMPERDEIKKALTGAGLAIRRIKTETIRQEYPSAEKMLKQLHDQGLTGGNIPQRHLLLNRSEISRLIADYAENYKSANGVYASYRVFYGVAAKEKHKAG